MKTRFVPAFAAALFLGGASPARTMVPDPALCPLVAMLAAEIMRGRQAGVSLADQLSTSDDPDISVLLRDMAMEARDEPRYSTPAMVARVTGEFRDSWHVRCLRSK